MTYRSAGSALAGFLALSACASSKGSQTNAGSADVGHESASVSGSGRPATVGQQDPAVQQEVRLQLAAVKRCYERSLQHNPNLSGKIVLRWTITAAGSVERVEVQSNTVRAPEVASCIKGLVAGWRFPARPGGPLD